MDPKEITGLMEAYSEVYAPQQELSEEQIWEEVENWVNSLLEEGYDLSEYTWEEMYEAYIEEAPMTAFQAGGGQAKLNQLNKGLSPRSGLRATPSTIERQGQDNLFKAGGGNAAIQKGPSTRQNTRGGRSIQVPSLTRQDIINKGTVAAGAKPAAAPAARPSGSSSAPAARPSGGSPAAKPAPTAAAPKVTPTAAAKPAGPATGTLGKTSFERRTPTSVELKGAQAARASGASPEKALQAAKSAGGALSQATAAASKPPAFSPSSSSSPAPAAAPKPNLQKSIRANRLNMSFDLFDVVMGHLLDEGYADTEEAALAIMANMSEEWRQSIVEQSNTLVTPDQRRADELKYGMKRTTPVPSKSAKSGPKMPL